MVPFAHRALLLAGIALAAGACADDGPVGPPTAPPETAPPPVHAAVQCRMDVRARTVSCNPAAPETPPGVSPLIVGSQGTNVRLASSGTSYDASTGIFRSSVTVQNLMAFALGTDDGYFPSPEGVRVFFHSGPTVTEGTGAVSVANADGEGIFTTAGQTYFQYDGVLAPGGTTAPREWRFNVPSTVDYFVFTVLVSAPIRGRAALPPKLFFLAGTGIADTVDARPDSVLRVAVRGANGKPAANILVQSDAVARTSPPYGYEVYIGPTYQSTDAQGIVELKPIMGERAGPGRVVISVPSLSLKDTVRYTILPGRATQVRSLPADTVVTMGGRVPLRLATFDRHGNERGDTVAVSVAEGPGTMAGNEVVAGSSIGRVRAVAAVGALRDTSYVGVVPPGTVAAHTRIRHSGDVGSIYVFPLDGTDVRRVHTSPTGFGYNVNMPVGGWLGGTTLVYQDGMTNHTNQLYVLDLQTGESTRFLAAADQMEMENFPRLSRDGQWVYFSGGAWSYWVLYRARADGTEKEELTFSYGGFSPSTYQWGADPSPDGTRIVFVQGNYSDEGQLTIGELASRVTWSLGVEGLHPRWSPDGSQVAFLERTHPFNAYLGSVAVVNADGTGKRFVTSTIASGAFDWSPDGKYLIGATDVENQLMIVEVATGAEVRVTYPGVEGVLTSPVWKP